MNDKTRTPDEPDRPAVAHPTGDGQGKHESARPADPHVVPAAPAHATDGAGNGSAPRTGGTGGTAAAEAPLAGGAAQPGANRAASSAGPDAAASPSTTAAEVARTSGSAGGSAGAVGPAGPSGVGGLSGAGGSAGESGAAGSAADPGAGSASGQRSAGAASRAARDATASRGAGVSPATPGSRDVAEPAAGEAVDSAAMTTPAMSLRPAQEPAAEPSAPTPPEGESAVRRASSSAGSAARGSSAQRQPGTPATGQPRAAASVAKSDDEPTTRMRFPAAANGKSPAGDQKTQPVAQQGTASAAVPMPGPAADAPPPWNRVPGQEPSPVLVENRPTDDAADVEGPTAFLGPPAPPSPPNERRPGRPWGVAGPSRGGRTRPPRQASLQLKRLDPWSVLKLALVLAVVLFLIWLVAVGVLYGVLDGIGVWDRLNGTYADLVSGEAPSGSPLISAGRVFGIAAVVGAINSLLFAVAVTVGAFVYNVSADLVGGIEVTLSERD